jgi:hypothetical protein
MTLLHDKGTLDLEAENPSPQKKDKSFCFFFLTLGTYLKIIITAAFSWHVLIDCPLVFFPFFVFRK